MRARRWTYSLEGTGAASFDIDASTGQIRTAGVTLDQSSYTVEVVASDGTDSDRITVTINVIANNPPVFSGGPRSFSVREDTPSGRPIGSPVRATDPDAGDTVTHALEGTDAASFSHRCFERPDTDAGDAGREHEGYVLGDGAGDGQQGRERDDCRDHQRHGPAQDARLRDPGRGGHVDAPNTGLVADCEALLKATDSLENGARILNWSVTRPISEWDGIRGRSDALEGGRVTKLYLHAWA